MTTLYRSPDIIIDAHEWHITVRNLGGRVYTTYFWRPVSIRRIAWSNVIAWQGPKPKGLWKFFKPFRNHIRTAMESEQARTRAARRLPVVQTSAMLRNATANRKGRK